MNKLSYTFDISVSLKPLQDSVKQISQVLSNITITTNATIKDSLLSPLQEFNHSYSELMKNINASIRLPLAEILKNINEISKCDFKKIDNLDPSDFIEPLDTLSELIDEDNSSDQVQNELSESKEELISVKNSIKSSKINLEQYIVLICTIITTIFSIVSYYKPHDYEEEILRTLNQINIKMEQDLKITK